MDKDHGFALAHRLGIGEIQSKVDQAPVTVFSTSRNQDLEYVGGIDLH